MMYWQPQTGDMASYHHWKEKHRVWKVPSSFAPLPLLRIKLYTFNQLPSCGFPTAPILRNPPIVPPLGKFRAVLQIRALPILYHGTPLSNVPTSNIIHGLSPQPHEEGNNYVNVLPSHVGRREKHPLHYQPKNAYLDAKVGSLLLGPELRVTSTEMLRVIQRMCCALDDYRDRRSADLTTTRHAQ